MSRFVSGGTISDDPSHSPTTAATPSSISQTDRDTAWTAAQSAIDATRLQQQQKTSAQPEKSLYETLQANKAAKQEAFESAAKLSNQFQSLDEDEIEFLDSVVAGERAKEAAVRKETVEQLEAFRRLQEESGKGGANVEQGLEGQDGSGEWKAGGSRKRKKGAGAGLLGGVKVRRTSSTAERARNDGTVSVPEAGTKMGDDSRSTIQQSDVALSTSKPASPSKPVASEVTKSPSPSSTGLGLAAYSSDEDD